MTDGLGATRWIIADGYIPDRSNGPEPEMRSHESASVLNTGTTDAHIAVEIFFSDRDPAGPYDVTVPARRTKHIRFDHLRDPEPIPLATEYSAVITSDRPVVVQHTRLDSRQAENALLSTIAFPAG